MSGPSDEEVVEVEEPAPVVMSNEGGNGDDGDEDSDDSVTKLTYKERALKAGRNYTVTDVPPIGTSIILGVQHYLTMLGATVRNTSKCSVVLVRHRSRCTPLGH